jgi:hypothetical protein
MKSRIQSTLSPVSFQEMHFLLDISLFLRDSVTNFFEDLKNQINIFYIIDDGFLIFLHIYCLENTFKVSACFYMKTLSTAILEIIPEAASES